MIQLHNTQKAKRLLSCLVGDDGPREFNGRTCVVRLPMDSRARKRDRWRKEELQNGR